MRHQTVATKWKSSRHNRNGNSYSIVFCNVGDSCGMNGNILKGWQHFSSVYLCRWEGGFKRDIAVLADWQFKRRMQQLSSYRRSDVSFHCSESPHNDLNLFLLSLCQHGSVSLLQTLSDRNHTGAPARCFTVLMGFICGWTDPLSGFQLLMHCCGEVAKTNPVSVSVVSLNPLWGFKLFVYFLWPAHTFCV